MERKPEERYIWKDIDLYSGIRVRARVIGTSWRDFKPVDRESIEYLQFEIGGNSVNCIYTSAEGGNLIYKAIKDKTLDFSEFSSTIHERDSFKAIRKITALLIENDVEYKIGPSRP